MHDIDGLKAKLVSMSKEVQKINNELPKEINTKDLTQNLHYLDARISNPASFVTFLGETSSGKSTIINGLIQKELLKTTASPTTGTVTQLILDVNLSNEEYYMLDEKYEISEIEKQNFDKLFVTPTENLKRLLVKVNTSNAKYNELNIIDTPGYNSIVLKHEEILKDFIPESDVLIHVVNYKVGFTKNDFDLLKTIFELTKDDKIPYILVINRCPVNCDSNDKRISEIKSNAQDALNRDFKTYMIESIFSNEENVSIKILPQNRELWGEVTDIANSDERLNSILINSQNILYQIVTKIISKTEKNESFLNSQKSEQDAVIKALNEFAEKKPEAIAIINKYHEKWKQSIPKMIDHRFNEMLNNIYSKIFSYNKWLEKDYCIAYLENHIIPKGFKDTLKEIENYLYTEVQSLDEDIENLGNQAIKKMEHVPPELNTESYRILINNVLKDVAGTLTKKVLGNYLGKLGGVGGNAAGLGNLAKMGVKRFGNVFGKAFNRNIYDKIGKICTKQFTKRLAIVVAALIEIGEYILDSKTWQKKLYKKIEEDINKEKIEISNSLINDSLVEMRDENISQIEEIFDEPLYEIEKLLENKDNLSSESENIKLKLQQLYNIQKQLGG